jgi:hypothetical protein
MSLASGLSSSFPKPGRSEASTKPETVSVMIRQGWTAP